MGPMRPHGPFGLQRALWRRIESENVGKYEDVGTMRKCWKMCWGRPEHVEEKLEVLGTTWKCWELPEHVGDILKMLVAT